MSNSRRSWSMRVSSDLEAGRGTSAGARRESCSWLALGRGRKTAFCFTFLLFIDLYLFINPFILVLTASLFHSFFFLFRSASLRVFTIFPPPLHHSLVLSRPIKSFPWRLGMRKGKRRTTKECKEETKRRKRKRNVDPIRWEVAKVRLSKARV